MYFCVILHLNMNFSYKNANKMLTISLHEITLMHRKCLVENGA